MCAKVTALDKQNKITQRRPKTVIFALAGLALGAANVAMPIHAMAAPTVIPNNSTTSSEQNNSNPDPLDPQVAPQPSSPFNPENPNNGTANNSGTSNVLNNPNSLAQDMQPSDEDLSAANQQLLSRNAKLQRDVNDLETRVNVLINERSGQLFMYGAVTVAISLILGFLLGWFIFGRRERW